MMHPLCPRCRRQKHYTWPRQYRKSHDTTNALTLALKSLRYRPLTTSINLLLIAVGITMMRFMLSVSRQFEDMALRDEQDIDLVVGAKGLPLQLTLSSVYHIDIPTENIPLAAKAHTLLGSP